MSGTSKDIKYGNLELDDLEFKPGNVKVRITTMIDEDILIELKRMAREKKTGYQTLLNQILRMFVTKVSQRQMPEGDLSSGVFKAPTEAIIS